MAYVRKTKDVYIVQEYVEGCGWEDSFEEETMKEAKSQARCYRENGFPARVVKRREKINYGIQNH